MELELETLSPRVRFTIEPWGNRNVEAPISNNKFSNNNLFFFFFFFLFLTIMKNII
jgi:hypothetical protein